MRNIFRLYLVVAISQILFAMPVCAETIAEGTTVAEWLENNQYAPKFKNYPAEMRKFTAAKNVDFNSYKGSYNYRTTLRNAFKEEPNFAGKYVVAHAGCGTQCSIYWIINKETGKIIFSEASQLGASYLRASNLFVMNGDTYGIDQHPDDTEAKYVSPAITVKFYKVENDKIKLIKSLPLPQEEIEN